MVELPLSAGLQNNWREFQNFWETLRALIDDLISFALLERWWSTRSTERAAAAAYARCDDKLITDASPFSVRTVRDKEEKCSLWCMDKYLKMNQRISQRFQEFQMTTNEAAIAASGGKVWLVNSVRREWVTRKEYHYYPHKSPLTERSCSIPDSILDSKTHPLREERAAFWPRQGAHPDVRGLRQNQ